MKNNESKIMFDYKNDSWKVIVSYLTDNNYENLIKHHINSFNDFMDNKVELIIKQLNPLSIYNRYNAETNTYDYEVQIEFGDVYYSKPVINENDGSSKIMTPHEARLRNLTYSSLVSVDIKIAIIKDPYNEKIWKYDPSCMDTQMVDRIPKPPLEDIIRSAEGNNSEGYLHQLFFHYPEVGGFQTIVDSLEKKIDC